MTKRSASTAGLTDDHEDARPRVESPTLSIDAHGTKRWYVDGKLHRLDGPAYEGYSHKSWWVDGKRHRLDGPAIEYRDGSKQWWINGKCHRLDGPAEVYADGNKQWWLYDQHYTEAEHRARVVLLKKLFGNLKMKRFLRLTRHSRQFAESFYAEGGMGRKWDLASLERTRLALEC